MTTAVSMTNLTKHYNGVPALYGPDTRCSGRFRLRLPRPQRRRQDDRDEAARGPRPGDERHGHDQRDPRVGVRGAST